jgi:methylthioribose-1-phosphate isomerase
LPEPPVAPHAEPPAGEATTSTTTGVPAGVTPDAGGGAPQAVDMGRRRFFRSFAGEIIQTAATVAGAAQALQQASAEAAGAILNPEVGAARLGTGATAGVDAADRAPAGFRTPFREDGGVLYLVDQRKLPDVLVEYPCRSAGEVSFAIREMIVRGAPAIGQVAAIGLAMAAEHQRDGRPYARKAVLKGSANALINARPTAVNLRWAVERVLARYTEVGELSEDGDAIADAMRAEADAIVWEATVDHGRLAEFGAAILPDRADGEPVRVLTHCNTGPLACGQVGTALGVVQVAHHAGRPVHVWVDETRPYLQGARLTTWELAQAGVPHALLPDVAAGHLMARGEVDVVLVGADRIAANGDTANKVGTYPLAVLAARHGIPFYVCAPTSSIDPATPDGCGIEIEERRADEVLEVRGVRIAPPGTDVRNPAFDVTPAELITGIVTEEGVVRAPFEAGLRAAIEAARARWAAIPGFRSVRPIVAAAPDEVAEPGEVAAPGEPAPAGGAPTGGA